ncbi:MAG: 2-pyrone-4,6-dicarboxylate hydrolase [Rhodospirillaceae bacterium]|nr:2-pyrone-4,6-dicarboxylate hydrolase [Rhodospirillaceae bacterium]|tara:strand:- start:215 stop:1087 length:873 start_codon:yes stop_codon:yes gene_type:complete
MKYCQGPDAKTKIPNFAVPPKACDAHCHVFGPANQFPFFSGRTYTPPDASYESMQVLQNILGIERAVIVQATCHGTDNSAALDAIKRSKGRYRGVAIVDEGFNDYDLMRLHEGGMRGVRFSFARHIGNAPDFGAVRNIANRIAPLGWHIVIYMEATDIVEYSKMLADLPLPVVIDHMGRVKTKDGIGQEPFQLLLNLLRDKEDFWVKICGAERISSQGPPFKDAIPFAQACIDVAPDRVLWGTDWPHPNIEGFMPNDGDLMDLLALHAPDEKNRHKILVDNPAHLYGFND